MNDRQLKCVLTLAEEKSFSEAAKKLGISQPSLSQYIQKIEDECGIQLFERSLPLQLTYAGIIYIEHAKNIINFKKQMEDILADVSTEDAGKIVIGAGPINSMTFLPGIVAEYRRKHPKNEIVMMEYTEKELAIKAENDIFDLVLSTQKVNDKKFDYIHLFDEEMLLAIREDNEFCRLHNDKIDGKYLVNLKDILDLQFIQMDEAFPIQKNLTAQFVKYGVEPKYTIKCGSIMTAYALAREGVGAMLLPSGTTRNSTYKEMRYYHLNPTPGVRPFGAYYLQGKYISRALQDFIDLLIQQ